MIVTYVMEFNAKENHCSRRSMIKQMWWSSRTIGWIKPKGYFGLRRAPDWHYCSDCAECKASGWECAYVGLHGWRNGKKPLSFMKLERRGTSFFTKIPKTLKQLRLFKSAACHLAWIWTPLVFFKVESRATKPTCERDWYHPCPRGSSLSSKNKRHKMFVVLRSQFEA